MEFRISGTEKDIRPYIMRRLSNALRAVNALSDMGLGDECLRTAAGTVCGMMHLVMQEDDFSSGEGDEFRTLGELFAGCTVYDPDDGDDIIVLHDGELFIIDGEKWERTFELALRAGELWKAAGGIAESLWVGGLLYAEAMRDLAAEILRSAGDLAHLLGKLDVTEAPYGIDFSPYFSSKYGVYYDTYLRAGWQSAFAPMGQERLRKETVRIHEREEFFERFLSIYDVNDGNIDLFDALREFPGADRRVEILRQLSHERENTYGSFSTFDPSELIGVLISEIRKDPYGGTYCPPGEDEATYACIVPQLREAWKRDHE